MPPPKGRNAKRVAVESDGDDSSDGDAAPVREGSELIHGSLQLRMVAPPPADREYVGGDWLFLDRHAFETMAAPSRECLVQAAGYFGKHGESKILTHLRHFIPEAHHAGGGCDAAAAGKSVCASDIESFKNSLTVSKRNASRPLFPISAKRAERYAAIFGDSVVAMEGESFVDFALLYKAVMQNRTRQCFAVYRRDEGPPVFLALDGQIFRTSVAQLYMAFITAICGVTDHVMKQAAKRAAAPPAPPSDVELAEGQFKRARIDGQRLPRGRAAHAPQFAVSVATVTSFGASPDDF